MTQVILFLVAPAIGLVFVGEYLALIEPRKPYGRKK